MVICQKSKVDDWLEHFSTYYDVTTYDFTKKNEIECFYEHTWIEDKGNVGVINYELAFRRPLLKEFCGYTLMLDESSLIQNETAKRSKFILNKLQPENIILLSGTPTSGRYERLWSQMKLLGWKISKDLFWKQYVDFHYEDQQGFPILIIDGYKNVERLKEKMRQYGCRFLKTEEVFDLPEQIFNEVCMNTTKEYRKFHKNGIVTIGEQEIVGDTTLTKMLYERQLCGQYCEAKLKALEDILSSTEDRVLIFYNFNEELYKIEDICYKLNKPTSIVNGQEKDLTMYKQEDNSVTLIQYQAGAMGLNLQLANKIVYFTPTLSSELFEQSKKRIHRIGQGQPCFYYELICKNSIEEKIYKTLAMRKDYTDKLFEQEC